MNELQRISNCKIHPSAKVMPFVNLYGAEIGEGCFIGPFVEIGDAVIGARTKVSSHTYICPHVEIGTDCFIAHGVMFTNDTFETPKTYERIEELSAQWTPRRTIIGNRVRIGSGAKILPVKIGDGAKIGAGAVVTKDVPAGETWYGNPAKKAKKAKKCKSSTANTA